MRIGIFGGSFNPVHRGHLRLARTALLKLSLDKVVFVPSRQSPLKKKEDLLPAALRVKLLRIALKGQKRFFVSLCEIKRKGPSYTVDTLKVFKRNCGKGTELFFLSGADTLKGLSRWKSLNEIYKLCRFVVMTRPGTRVGKTPQPVFFVPLDALPVSSTEIRERLGKQRSVQGLVPPGTEKPLLDFYKKNTGGLKSKQIKK